MRALPKTCPLGDQSGFGAEEYLLPKDHVFQCLSLRDSQNKVSPAELSGDINDAVVGGPKNPLNDLVNDELDAALKVLLTLGVVV